MTDVGIPTDLPASYTAQMVWAVMEERKRVAAARKAARAGSKPR